MNQLKIIKIKTNNFLKKKKPQLVAIILRQNLMKNNHKLVRKNLQYSKQLIKKKVIPIFVK